MKKAIKSGYKGNIARILAIFFCIFPWITYTKIIEYNEAECSVFSSYEGLAMDFFLYYKARILIVLALFVACWFIGEHIFPDKVDKNVPLLRGNNKWLFILVGCFLGGTIISTLISKYQKNALWGSPTEGEGLFTLVGYVVLILAFYNYFANEYGLMLIKKAITVVSVVTVVLSCVEYLYKPIVEIGFIQKLIAPAEYAAVLDTATAEAFDGAVALTFNNPGYYGGFVCILFPFAISGFFGGKQKVEKIINGVLIVGLMFCVIVSNSTTAFYVAIIELALLLIAYLINMIRNKSDIKTYMINLGITLSALFFAVVFYSVASGNSIWDIVTNANSATGKEREDRYVITDIQLEENNVIIQGKETALRITFDNGAVEVFDEKNQKLDAEYIDGKLVFADVAYKDVTVGVVTNSDATSEIRAKLSVNAGYDDTIDFFILRDGSISGVGQNNAIITDIEGNSIPEVWKKYYGMFTGRGYAWANSMPILKDTLLIGVGPGNFAYYFKQHDYVGMLQTHESIKMVVDKPHNMYLQYAINLGVPGMLGFFGILAYALISSVRLRHKNKEKMTEMSAMHIGATVAIVGFSIISIMNDSIITVTPTICMLTGVLLAMNHMLVGGYYHGKVKK